MEERLNPHTFTDKELKWSYWFVTHRLILEKIIFIVLLIITIFLGILFLYKVVDVFALKGKYYQQGFATLANVPAVVGELQMVGENAVVDMQVLDTQTLTSSGGRIDLIAQIGNPNSKYTGYFNYRFNVNGQFSEWQSGFILPGQTRYIHELGFEADDLLSQGQVEIENFRWEKSLEFDTFSQERLQFTFDEVEFIPSSQNEAGQESGNQVKFKVTNNSAYAFRQVGFFVGLYSGGGLQSVNHIKLDNIYANMSYDVSIPWYDDLGSVTRVEILPEINILDQSKYLKLK